MLPRPLVCANPLIHLSPGRHSTDWSTIGQDHFAAGSSSGGRCRSPGAMSRTRIVVALRARRARSRPIVLVALVGSEPAKLTPNQHFGLVGGAAALTSLASLLLSVAGARARDGRAILMGTAFSTMTALFAIHALSTPGFLVGKNGMIALAGGLSVPVGVSDPRADRASRPAPPGRRPRPASRCRSGLFVGIIVLGGVGLAFPEDDPRGPEAQVDPGGAALRRRRHRAAAADQPRRAHLPAHAPGRRPGRRGRLHLARRDAVREPHPRLRHLRLRIGAPARDRRRRARRPARPRWTSSAPAPHARWSATSPPPSWSPARRPTSARACAP